MRASEPFFFPHGSCLFHLSLCLSSFALLPSPSVRALHRCSSHHAQDASSPILISLSSHTHSLIISFIWLVLFWEMEAFQRRHLQKTSFPLHFSSRMVSCPALPQQGQHSRRCLPSHCVSTAAAVASSEQISGASHLDF